MLLRFQLEYCVFMERVLIETLYLLLVLEPGKFGACKGKQLAGLKLYNLQDQQQARGFREFFDRKCGAPSQASWQTSSTLSQTTVQLFGKVWKKSASLACKHGRLEK